MRFITCNIFTVIILSSNSNLIKYIYNMYVIDSNFLLLSFHGHIGYKCSSPKFNKLFGPSTLMKKSAVCSWVVQLHLHLISFKQLLNKVIMNLHMQESLCCSVLKESNHNQVSCIYCTILLVGLQWNFWCCSHCICLGSKPVNFLCGKIFSIDLIVQWSKITQYWLIIFFFFTGINANV